VRIHLAALVGDDGCRNERRAPHLTPGTPVEEVRVIAGTAHVDRVAAPCARLTVAAIDIELGRRSGQARWLRSGRDIDLVHVGTHERCRGDDDVGTVGAVERRDRGERVQRAGPQGLASIDVADVAGDVLVEQRLGHRGILVVVVVQPVDALVEVGLGAAQLGTERTEAGMP
jgi:hypothetical protein